MFKSIELKIILILFGLTTIIITILGILFLNNIDVSQIKWLIIYALVINAIVSILARNCDF